MPVIFDLIGSAIIAGYVLLLGLNINANIASSSVASTTTLNVQESMAEAVRGIEYDLKKIGYGLADPADALALADSNKIRFRADLNRDGIADSVEYYLGSPLAKFPGQNVRTLYRKFNNGAPTIVAPCVRQFKLAYLDQAGLPTILAAKMSMMEITIELISPYKIVDQVNPDKQGYMTTLWRQSRITTRNILRHG